MLFYNHKRFVCMNKLGSINESLKLTPEELEHYDMKSVLVSSISIKLLNFLQFLWKEWNWHVSFSTESCLTSMKSK